MRTQRMQHKTERRCTLELIGASGSSNYRSVRIFEHTEYTTVAVKETEMNCTVFQQSVRTIHVNEFYLRILSFGIQNINIEQHNCKT